VNELRDRITRATEFFTNKMLASTCPETENHLDECRTTNGAILRCTVRKKTL
jgi:hypothetical protein